MIPKTGVIAATWLAVSIFPAPEICAATPSCVAAKTRSGSVSTDICGLVTVLPPNHPQPYVLVGWPELWVQRSAYSPARPAACPQGLNIAERPDRFRVDETPTRVAGFGRCGRRRNRIQTRTCCNLKRVLYPSSHEGRSHRCSRLPWHESAPAARGAWSRRDRHRPRAARRCSAPAGDLGRRRCARPRVDALRA